MKFNNFSHLLNLNKKNSTICTQYISFKHKQHTIIHTHNVANHQSEMHKNIWTQFQQTTLCIDTHTHPLHKFFIINHTKPFFPALIRKLNTNNPFLSNSPLIYHARRTWKPYYPTLIFPITSISNILTIIKQNGSKRKSQNFQRNQNS